MRNPKTTRPGLTATIAACALALILAAGAPRAAADSHESADPAQAVRDADVAWSKTAEAGDFDAFLANFLDAAVVLPPNAPMAVGREAVDAFFRPVFESPGFGVRWHPLRIEAAASGDLAYSLGTYDMTLQDGEGNFSMERGKYTTVWKKQEDGTWKVAVDMFSPNIARE